MHTIKSNQFYFKLNKFSQYLDEKCFMVMICFIYVQHMNHRVQIMQERLMTTSVKLMQQPSSSLSQGDTVFVTNNYCSPPT